MITSELIKTFFEEQFGDYDPGYSYADHQLLKENKFQEFFDLLLAKSRKRFFYGFPIAIAFIIIGLIYFWSFMEAFAIMELVLAIFWIIVGGMYLFWTSRQFFIIRSSVSLFQKMLAKADA